MRIADLKHIVAGLGILCIVVTACIKPSPTPAPTLALPTREAEDKASPGGASIPPADRPLCESPVAEEATSWQWYWRTRNAGDAVSALLLTDRWLWVATPSGLARVDRQTLDCTLLEHTPTDPPLALSQASSLAQDPHGCMWVAASGGVARWCADGSPDGHWQPVTFGHLVNQIAFDAEGNLWTYTSGGRWGASSYYRYPGAIPPAEGAWSGEQIAYDAVPSDACENWSSKDWFPHQWEQPGPNRFRTSQECRDLSTWLERFAILALPDGWQPLTQYALVATDGDHVWLFAAQGQPESAPAQQYALVRLTDDGSQDFAPRITVWPYAFDPYSAVMVADEQRAGVWVGWFDGLAFSDDQTVQKIALTLRDLIPVGAEVFTLKPDRAGRLWAVTSEGLMYLDDEADDWLPTEISSAALIAPDDQGGLWALSFGDGQIGHFNGESWSHLGGAESWACSPVDIAADVGGGLWMTSYQCGLSGFDGAQWTSFRNDADVQGARLARAPDGDLYVASVDDRIQRYDGLAWTVLPDPDPESAVWVNAMVVDARGGLWVTAVRSRYLYYFDGSRWTDFSDEAVVPLVALFVDDRGELWAGGEQALLHYDGQSWEQIPVPEMVVALAQDRRGRIWFSGSSGLYVYNPSDVSR